MTMPTYLNCPHSPDGWCLTCVTEYANTQYELLTQAREQGEAVAHVLIKHGVVPGDDADLHCRCEQCRFVAQRMAEAGYLDHFEDRWWEHT